MFISLNLPTMPEKHLLSVVKTEISDYSLTQEKLI